MSGFIDSLSEDELRKICAFTLIAAKSDKVVSSEAFRAIILSLLDPPSTEMLEMLSAVEDGHSGELSGRKILVAEQPSIAEALGLDESRKSPDKGNSSPRSMP